MSATDTPPDELYYRHSWPVRVMHWLNVVAFLALLMSGLQIFNAHPALNWGQSSYGGEPPVLEMSARSAPDGKLTGVTRVLGFEFTSTGLFGVSRDAAGQPVVRGFPTWATVPSIQWLGMAREWHFFFAWLLVINGVAYVSYALLSRHAARRLLPSRDDLRSIGPSISDHVHFRHPTGEAAKRYNVLQKFSYLAVIFVLFPLIVLMGWAMSPWLDSVLPGWVGIVGGRQSARTLHFILAFALLGFLLVHVFEVVISGFWNHIRSMITGFYRVPHSATPVLASDAQAASTSPAPAPYVEPVPAASSRVANEDVIDDDVAKQDEAARVPNDVTKGQP